MSLWINYLRSGNKNNNNKKNKKLNRYSAGYAVSLLY